MRLIAFIEAGEVSRHILEHLGLPAQVPAACPARAPPTPLQGSDAEPVIDVPRADRDPESDPDYPVD